MNKFLVLYFTPVSVLEAWAKKDPEERKTEEARMQQEWQAWTNAHTEQIAETGGAGKTKRITPEGIADTKNDIMLYSLVSAGSHEAAAALFKGHPHLQIPESRIEVMAVTVLL